MDLEDYNFSLEKWLEYKADKCPEGFPSDFPGNDNFYTRRYKVLVARVQEHLHPFLDKATLVAEGKFLTDHGPEHVERVISKASELARAEGCELTPYEVYILLCAIQCHDLGLILGKTDHGENAVTIMSEIKNSLEDDSTEWRAITDIARVHSANHDADKDTITRLDKTLRLNQKSIRPRLLAAILKLSDELSDWRGRESRFLMDKEEIIKGSQVYHKYSHSLHYVCVEHSERRIVLEFELTDVKNTLLKGDNEVYLLDEILNRTLKVFLEAKYCSRFFRPQFDIEQVSVAITVCNENGFQELDKIKYLLEDRGYPADPNGGILSLCEELSSWHDNKPLSGVTLIEKMEVTG